MDSSCNQGSVGTGWCSGAADGVSAARRPLATPAATQYSPVMSFLNPPKAEVRRRRILVGGASVVLTTLVMTAFLLESRSGYSKPDARVILFQSWPADRSREDTLADQRATRAAQEAKLAEARAYIATLSGEARVKAQEQYEAYVTGGGADKEIPYVAAKRSERETPYVAAEPVVR